jgi:hypothetical protein
MTKKEEESDIAYKINKMMAEGAEGGGKPLISQDMCFLPLSVCGASPNRGCVFPNVKMLHKLFLFFLLQSAVNSQLEDVDIASDELLLQSDPEKHSHYNRTEILQKYSKEQISRRILINEKSQIFREWDLRYFSSYIDLFAPHPFQPLSLISGVVSHSIALLEDLQSEVYQFIYSKS